MSLEWMEWFTRFALCRGAKKKNTIFCGHLLSPLLLNTDACIELMWLLAHIIMIHQPQSPTVTGNADATWLCYTGLD